MCWCISSVALERLDYSIAGALVTQGTRRWSVELTLRV